MTEPMILRARVQAPLKEVLHALTEPEALRAWLAEYAEVDLPDRFEFWGRYTPEGYAPHQRLLYADDHTLRFTWLLDGEETTTEIRLEEESATSTVVTLSQTHFDIQEVFSGVSVRGVLQTFWALAIANLVDYVEGRELSPKCDFTSTDMRAEVVIAAPVDAVYDSMIGSEEVSRWFGYPIEIEPFVGGRFAMGGFDTDPQPAKVIDLVPGRSMSTDWGFGVVTWELEDTGGATRLTFVQSGFDTTQPPYAGWAGWLSGLAELRRFHELSDWRPIWLDDQAAG